MVDFFHIRNYAWYTLADGFYSSAMAQIEMVGIILDVARNRSQDIVALCAASKKVISRSKQNARCVALGCQKLEKTWTVSIVDIGALV